MTQLTDPIIPLLATLGDDDLIYVRATTGSGKTTVKRLAEAVARRIQNRTFRNLLLNPDMVANQRAFAGGALAANVYGFDMWKAGTGGCTLTRGADGLITLNGPLTQIIEAPALNGTVVFFSVEDATGPITVRVGDGGANFVEGSFDGAVGRAGVAVTVPAAVTTDVHVRITTSGSTSFYRPQLEQGAFFTGFEKRPIPVEANLLRRYYQTGVGDIAESYASAGGQLIGQLFQLRDRMRVNPVVTATRVSDTNMVDANPTVTVLDPAGFKVTGESSAAGICTMRFNWVADASP